MKSNLPPSEHSEQPNTLGDILRAKRAGDRTDRLARQVVGLCFFAWLGFAIAIGARWGLVGLGLWVGIPFVLLALFTFATLCLAIRKGGES